MEYIKKLKHDQIRKRVLEDTIRIQEIQNKKLQLQLEVETETKNSIAVPLMNDPFSLQEYERIVQEHGISRHKSATESCFSSANVLNDIKDEESKLFFVPLPNLAFVKPHCNSPDQICPSTNISTSQFCTKSLDEFIDDECGGPVSNGDPMLSSPHLSPSSCVSTSLKNFLSKEDEVSSDSIDMGSGQ